MLSPGPRSPLNSNTATVLSTSSLFLSPSSSSSSSLSSSSSSYRATSKHRHKGSSLLPPYLVSPCSSLFTLVLFCYFMSQALVCSAPSVTRHHVATWKHSMHSGKHYSKEHLRNASSCTDCQDELPQMDESPRSIPQGVTVPHSWTRQFQNRFYYLRAENDQYLQLHGFTISGTRVGKPDYGIVRFQSHDKYVVIQSNYERRYLCMNDKYTLYLSDKLSSECYINESSLQSVGSHTTAYDFVKYQKDKKLYLGINCDPLLGTETDLNMDAIRFIPQDVTEEEAERVRTKIERSASGTHVAQKCERLSDQTESSRIKRRKLRYRWCWNIDRMVSYRYKYLQQCRKREDGDCDKEDPDRDSKDCVCDILSRMLLKPKRAKRKCLIEKLTKWVENQNKTSNSKAIVEASKILMRSYSGIARRMRLLKSRQNNHELQQREKQGQMNSKIHNVSPEGATQTHHPSSTQNPHPERSHPRRHEKKRRKNRRRRRPVVKLNSILERFRHELIQDSDSASLDGVISVATPASASKGNHAPTGIKLKELSVLSDEFKRVLNSLTNPPSQRRKIRHRKRRTRKSRREKTSETALETPSAAIHASSYRHIETAAPG